MKKCNVTVCTKCSRVKKYGVFLPLKLSEMYCIQQNKDKIVVIETTCPDCIDGKEP